MMAHFPSGLSWVVLISFPAPDALGQPAFAGGSDPAESAANTTLTTCLVGDEYFDFGPHRDDLEAEMLAMEVSGELRAPDSEYNRILGDLQSIRTHYMELAGVVDRPDYAPDQFFVRLVDGVPQEDYDALNIFYQVVDDRTYIYVPRLHLLTFCDNLNAPVLAQEYESLPEVLYAEPNYTIGDGDHITVTPLGTTYRYTIGSGFGDCLMGCICRQVWVIDVEDSGELTLISYEESGPSWCEFPDMGIPALSAWGMGIMTLLVLTVGTAVFRGCGTPPGK